MYSSYYLFLFFIIVGFTYFVLQFRVNSINPISSRLILTVKQLQPVMAEQQEAAKLFKQHKRLLTNSYCKLCRYIAKRSVELFESHRTCMNGLFKQFDELFDSVIDILVELPNEQWNKDMFKTYDSYLQSLQTTDFSEKYVKKLLIPYRRYVRNSKGCKKLQ